MFCAYQVTAIGNRILAFDGRYYSSVHTFAFHDVDRSFVVQNISDWCIDQFGEDTENVRWWRFGDAIAIFGDDDAMAFRMRWGGQTDG